MARVAVTEDQFRSLKELISHCLEVDHQPPFSDQSLVELRQAKRSLVELDSGFAITSESEIELAVEPETRRKGIGFRLVKLALEQDPKIQFAWAHGDHPGAKVLAERFGFQAVRTLLQLQAEVHAAITNNLTQQAGLTVRAFRPGQDDAAWLALNAKAFADHPEQGSLTSLDLSARMTEDWFRDQDFLLLQDAERLIGFCWLKVTGREGEFYAVGVDPEYQGRSIGKILMQAGMSRLAQLGVKLAKLYVEADNSPALKLYSRFGFDEFSRDVQYQRLKLPSA